MFFGSVEKPPRLSEFELEVPEKLIAQDPCEKRDECKIEQNKLLNIVNLKMLWITSIRVMCW